MPAVCMNARAFAAYYSSLHADDRMTVCILTNLKIILIIIIILIRKAKVGKETTEFFPLLNNYIQQNFT
jgi:hypothetical protein